jgi:hypothetical protein
MRRRVGVGVLVLVAGIAGACSDDGGDDEQGSATSAETAELPQDEGRWLPTLRVLPDTPDVRAYVVMADVATAAEQTGADNPGPDASSDDVVDWFRAMETPDDGLGDGLPPFDWSSDGPQDDEEFRAERGWSQTQMTHAVQAGIAPETYHAYLGAFDPEAVGAVLAEVPYWSEVQETVPYGGSEYYRWGEDDESNFDHVSVARPLGIGGRMVVEPDAVLLARADAAIEAMIDARAGTGSMADVEDFALIAEALDDQPVFGAMLTDDILEAPADDEAPALEGVEAYGTAWGLEDGEMVTVLVLVSATEADAEANVQRLTDRLDEGFSTATRQPYREMATIEASEVDGRVSVLRLDAEQPQFLIAALFRQDPIIANAR